MAKKSFKDAIAGKTDLKEKSGIKGMFSSTEGNITDASTEISVLISDNEVPEEIRQSFIVLSNDLEKLKDYVYHKKSTVDPLFSQKEALHLALQMLFGQEEEIPERPERVKKQERLRNANIRKKRVSK